MRYARAKLILENPSRFPGLRAIDGYSHLFSLYRYPAFSSWHFWSVFRSKQDVLVRRIVWDPRMDRSKSMNEESEDLKTFGSDAVLEVATVDRILDALQKVQIAPFITCDTLGIDGVTYGIKFGSYFRSAEYSWWCEPPEAWHQLKEWYDKTLDAIEARFPITTPDRN